MTGRWLALLLVVVTLLVTTKCIVHVDAETPELKCLFVYSNDISDFGYVFAYEQGRIDAERKLTSAPYNYSIKTDFVIAPNASTADQVVLPYIADGYTLFLFNGGQFTTAINRLAPAYPALKFLGTSAVPKFNNTAMVVSRNYEWYFLNGVICGMATKTNKIAYLTVFGIHADPFLNSNAFWHGATMANPNVQVTVASSYSYVDEVVAMYAVDKFAEQGIDCLAINQNIQTANARATTRNIMSCGTSSDSRFIAGEYVLTSGIRVWDDTIFGFIKQVLDNQWQSFQLISDGFYQNALKFAWWSTVATRPEYDAMRSTVEHHRDILAQSPNETIFCGSLATTIGYAKQNESDCMSLMELLSVRRIVPNVTMLPTYTRQSVTVFKYIGFGNSAAIAVICICAFFILMILGAITHMMIFRHRKVYVASSLLFMVLIMTGMIMVLISCISWALKPSVASCATRPWIGGIGWMLIVSALLAKTHRIYEIFSRGNLKVTVHTNAAQILKIMVGMLAGELSILIFWQALDPMKHATKIIPGLAYNEVYYYCKSKHITPLAVFLAYNTVALLPNVIVAWITRRTEEMYNESSAVGLSSAVIIFIGTVVIGITKVVSENIYAQYLLPTLGMCTIVVVMFGLLFLPKMLYVHGLWDTTSVESSGVARTSYTSTKSRRNATTRSTSGSSNDGQSSSVKMSTIHADKSRSKS